MSGTEPTIRAATRADLPAINAIYNEEIRTGVATWDYEAWSLEDRVRWFEGQPAEEPVLVAELDGEVVGFAYLSPYRSKFGYRFTREDTLYLERGYQGRGLGRLLLMALIAQARECGLRTLIGVIEASNAASIALHERLGFERCSYHREVGHKFGRWLDSVEMQLLLPGGGDEG